MKTQYNANNPSEKNPLRNPADDQQKELPVENPQDPQEPQNPQDPKPQEIKAGKGLFFPQRF